MKPNDSSCPCTVVIPAPPGHPEPQGMEALPAEWEILVAVGRQPSVQRNAAIRAAAGRWIWFLDSDCLPPPPAIASVCSIISSDCHDVVGGPVVLPPRASAREAIFQAVLGHRWVTGPSAARYAPLGEARPSDERELILANLLVRRAVFEGAGFFDERLYPNEENEWLDRQRGATRIAYDPRLAVARPQRASWRAFLWMLFRYGAGRTRQARLVGRADVRLLLPLFVLLAMAFAVVWPAWAAGIAAAGVVAIGATADGQLARGPSARLAVGLGALAAWLAYAAGQIAGWFWNAVPPPAGAGVELRRVPKNPAEDRLGKITFSIVTPSFRQGRFLEATVRSVLAQAAPGLTVDYHILDNHSDDETPRVLAGLAGSPVRITVAPDRGQADAINRGFAAAAGDWLAWLNADDLYEPGALATVAAAIRVHPDARWVVGAFRIIDTHGKPVGFLHSRYKNFLLRRYSYPLLLSENIIPQMSVFIRRDLFDEAGSLRTDDPLAFDYEYWLRLGAICPPLVIGDVLSAFRYHPASLTARHLRTQFGRELDYARRHAGARRWPIWLHQANYWKTVLFYDLVKRF